MDPANEFLREHYRLYEPSLSGISRQRVYFDWLRHRWIKAELIDVGRSDPIPPEDNPDRLLDYDPLFKSYSPQREEHEYFRPPLVFTIQRIKELLEEHGRLTFDEMATHLDITINRAKNAVRSACHMYDMLKKEREGRQVYWLLKEEDV